jgi:hypothetical protein
MPDFDEIYNEVSKKGKHKKTRQVLYGEYRLKYGNKAYKDAHFYALVRQELKYKYAFMKQFYKPAEILCIDYAGTRIKYTVRGKVNYLSVLVACFGFSKKLFAFATKDMTSKSWIYALTQALEYFGGVPEVVQFDNAKTMVTKAGMIALLNDNAKAFSIHYDCICDTSRVGTPTDNGVAESAVKYTSQRALEEMNRDHTFFSQAEVNAHLLQEVDKLNAAPFQKQSTSRNELFENEEKPALKPLPLIPFPYFTIQKKIKVPSIYLIPYKGHEYSVPYTLVGKDITVRITETEFVAYDGATVVAQHLLSEKSSGFTRLPEHMKPSHLAQESKSKETFMAWAHDISPDVEKIIEKHYSFTSNAKSRVVGKHCMALQKLCDACGEEVFGKACCYANERNWHQLDDIELVIRAKAYKHDAKPNLLAHHNIRGKGYFEEKSDE